MSTFITTDGGFLFYESFDRIIVFIKGVIVDGVDLWESEVHFAVYLP